MPYNLARRPGMPLNLAKCLVMPYNLPVGGQYWCEVLRLILWSGSSWSWSLQPTSLLYQQSVVVSSGLVSLIRNQVIANPFHQSASGIFLRSRNIDAGN